MKKFLDISHKSLSEFGVATYSDLWKKVMNEYGGLCITLKTEFKKSEDAPNKFHAIFSTDSEDRHGDVVVQEWDLKSFKKNPVYLDSHNYDSIVHILGKVHEPSSKSGSLMGDVEFFTDNPKGMLAQKAAEQGFLNANSVGFIPKKFDDKGTILESELLEISAVSVPANAEALFEKAEEKAPKEGDECDMGDGNMGTMQPSGDGQLVCMAKKEEKKEEPKEEKIITPKTATEVLAGMADKRRAELKLLAKNIHEFAKDRRVDKKRKILQSIRNLLEE